MKNKALKAVFASFMATAMLSGTAFAAPVNVTINEKNGAEPVTLTVEEGEVLHELPLPDMDGTNIFAGWYADENCEIPFNIETPITKDTQIYAKWESLENPFTDIDSTHRFFKGVSRVYNEGLMIGVSDDKFAPESTLTRAMVVTILHRMEGEPIVNYAMSFKDVPSGEYYTEAVRWAQATGIVMGVSDTEFAPTAEVTREQLAAIMYRYSQDFFDTDKLSEDTNTLSYNDIFDTAEWARPAFHFCLATGIITDRADRNVEPGAPATRAEAANAFATFRDILEREYLQEEPNYTGIYSDSVSQRASLNAEDDGTTVKINVHWSSSATESTDWVMTAKRDGAKLVYNDCVMTNTIFGEDGDAKEEKIYENGEGYFIVSKGALIWEGAKDENCRECVFEKEDITIFPGIPSPIKDASAASIETDLGFKFGDVKDAKGVQYFTINDTMAEMMFQFDNVGLCARIESKDKFEDISGMHYQWTSEEDCKIKNCEGKVMRYIGDDGMVDVCLWYDVVPGIMYSVSAQGKDLNGFDIQAIAEQLYIPMQGDVG